MTHKMICPNCSVALMYPHPEEKLEHLWTKCELCGYCEEIDPEKRKELVKKQASTG